MRLEVQACVACVACVLLLCSSLVAASYCDGIANEQERIKCCEDLCLRFHAVPMVTLGCFPHAAWHRNCYSYRLTSGCQTPVKTFISVSREDTTPNTTNPKPNFDRICEQFVGRKLVVLSAAHKPYGLFSVLLESVVRHNLHIHVLGWDTTQDFLHSQKDYKDATHYFGSKVVMVAYLLQTCRSTIPDDTVVMFVDGSDSIFQRGESYILDHFYKIGAPIVFSTEQGMMPAHAHSKRLYTQKYNAPPFLFANRAPYRYLNSGGYMGYAGALRRWMLEWVNAPFIALDFSTMTPIRPPPVRIIAPIEEIWEKRHSTVNGSMSAELIPFVYRSNDQVHATYMFLSNVENATLDYSTNIFMCMYIGVLYSSNSNNGEHFELRSSTPQIGYKHVYMKKTRTVPAVLHYNGPAKTESCGAYDPISAGGFDGTRALTQAQVDKHVSVLDHDLNIVRLDARAVERSKPRKIHCGC